MFAVYFELLHRPCSLSTLESIRTNVASFSRSVIRSKVRSTVSASPSKVAAGSDESDGPDGKKKCQQHKLAEDQSKPQNTLRCVGPDTFSISCKGRKAVFSLGSARPFFPRFGGDVPIQQSRKGFTLFKEAIWGGFGFLQGGFLAWFRVGLVLV